MISRALGKFAVLGLVVWTSPSFAKFACDPKGVAIYRLGTEYESSGLTIREVIAAGQVVAQGTGKRSGETRVLECWANKLITYTHAWVPASAEPVRPLTIGGRPSGLGLRASAKGAAHQEFSYPATTQEKIGENSGGWIPLGKGVILLGNETVSYDIVRLPGPLLYGRIDEGLVARSTAPRSGAGGDIAYRDVQMAGITVNRPACRIVTEDLGQVVKMAEYTTDDFVHGEQATPWKAFHFRVASCPDPSGVIARFTFGDRADGSAANGQWFSLPPSGPKQVALQLGTADFANVAPGVPIRLRALGNGQTYTFNARLRRTGQTITPGRFSRGLRLLVEYL